MAKNQGPWGNNDNANPWGDNEETLNSPKVVDFSVLERIKKRRRIRFQNPLGASCAAGYLAAFGLLSNSAQRTGRRSAFRRLCLHDRCRPALPSALPD